MSKIKIVESDVIPICPFCKEELPIINLSSKGFLEYKKVFSCPHCRAVLGVGFGMAG